MGCSQSKPVHAADAYGAVRGGSTPLPAGVSPKNLAQVAPDRLASSAQQAASAAAGEASAAASGVTASSKHAWDKASSNVAQNGDAAVQAATSVQDAASSAASSARDTASTAASSARDAASTAASSARDTASVAASSARDAASGAAASARSTAAGAADSARATANDAARAAQTKASDAAAAARAKASDASTAVHGAADTASQRAAAVVQDSADAVNSAADELDADDEPASTVVLTARKKVGGNKCVVTVKRNDDDSGFHINVFHPASELQHDLFLTPEQLQDALPEELHGEENELEQLHYVRDNLRLAGPMDNRHLELVPSGGIPIEVHLRDRRIVGGKIAHITIGVRDDGNTVVRAFNPASEIERELTLTPGQLRALLPNNLHGEENEVEQLHWISHNLHYVRRPNGQVALQAVPPGSTRFLDEVDALAKDGTPATAVEPAGAGSGGGNGDDGGDSGDESEDDGSSFMLYRNQVRIGGKRAFVTIARRKNTLVVRALNPAAQREAQLVIPMDRLPHLLPPDLLREEAETEMLGHIASDLCFKTDAKTGADMLVMQGEVHALHLQDEAGAGAADAAGDEEEAAEQPELHQLMRTRRTIGGLKVYLTIGRRDGVLVVNVFSPSRSSEVEVALPMAQLVYVVPRELLGEEVEPDMVQYIADSVVVEAVGEASMKVSIKNAPPAAPAGDPDTAISEAAHINGEEHTVTAERFGDVLVLHAYNVRLGKTTTTTVDLRRVRVELATGTRQERELAAEDRVDDLILYLVSLLEYVEVPFCRKLEVAGVTGPGAVVDRGFSKTVSDGEDYWILGLKRSDDRKAVEASAFNTESHVTITSSVAMDAIAGWLANDPDGPALMKEVKLEAFFQRLCTALHVRNGELVFDPAAPTASE